VPAPPILNRPFAVFVARTTCDRFVNRHFRPAHILRELGKSVNATELVEKLVSPSFAARAISPY
jgi:hypothetical protein